MDKALKKHLKDGKFDNVSSTTSKTMAAIKGRNNKTTEVKFKMLLVRNRISGFVMNFMELPGKPDFYFPKRKLAVFIDGCFWHGCPICGHIPKTRSDFWKTKIQRTQQRDSINNEELKKMGIGIIRIWEHELKGNFGAEELFSQLSIT